MKRTTFYLIITFLSLTLIPGMARVGISEESSELAGPFANSDSEGSGSMFGSIFDSDTGYSLEETLDVILEDSPIVAMGRANEAYYQGLQAQAFAAHLPNISILQAFGPTPEITGDANSSDIDWFGKWGAFYRLESTLTVPIYTFNRITYAEEAAAHGLSAAEAETDSMTWELIKMVKEMYYGNLLANTLYERIIGLAEQYLNLAVEYAEESIESGDGAITMVDYNKLMVGKSTLESYKLEARRYLDLTASALGLTMGLDEDEEFIPNNDSIEAEFVDLLPIEDYVDIAYESSPIIRMIESGLSATQALVDFERGAYYPIIALFGNFNYGAASAVQDVPSYFANDPFNDLSGGVAIAIVYDINFWDVRAHVMQAEAEHQELLHTREALDFGLELMVREIYGRIIENDGKIQTNRQGFDNAKAWFMSAGLAYQSGFEEADQVLEGLVAFATAAMGYYQAIMDYNMALAELSSLLGQEITYLEYNLP